MVISAIILAAGESKRMGQPKMLLKWGQTTVLGHVISTFQQAGIQDIVVVVGGARKQVEEIVDQHGARSVYNEEHANGEMLLSLQRGIEAQSPQTQATLIALGDQPQIQEGTVRLICEAFQSGKFRLIVPSFEMRRGHPWLVERSLWKEILAMRPQQSPRDFLNQHAQEIDYVQVRTSSILADIDTLEDYQRSRPQI
jgi:molybdenum cofactor cytidylyltransferase